MFNLFRAVKESLPDVFDLSISRGDIRDRRATLQFAFGSRVTEESRLDGNWEISKAVYKSLLLKYFELDKKCPRQQTRHVYFLGYLMFTANQRDSWP